MAELILNNKIKARHFYSTKRFIDNLYAITGDGEFRHNHAEIYSKKLQLRPEHQDTYVSFLNLGIHIVDGKCVRKLYDKRDSFPFFIVRIPHIDSNMFISMFYSVLVGETYRQLIQVYVSLIFSQRFLNRYQEYFDKVAKHKSVIHFWKNYKKLQEDFFNLIRMLNKVNSLNIQCFYFDKFVFIYFNQH